MTPGARRVLEWAERAESGDWDWYERFAQDVAHHADRFGVDRWPAACAYAILSPGMLWAQNRALAEAVLAGRPVAGLALSFTGQAKVFAARRALRSEWPERLPAGLKIRAFARLLYDPEDPYAVVVDRHATRVVTGDGSRVGPKSDADYRALSLAYYEAAAETQKLACQVQAAAWCAYRRARKAGEA